MQRVGTTTREATRQEEARLYQRSGQIRYGLAPISEADFGALDRRRLEEYFGRVQQWDSPATDAIDEWRTLLTNLDLATEVDGRTVATVDGMLLFGRNPKKFLPQSGIRAVCFPGADRDYATRADEVLKGPLVALRGSDGSTIERGLVEQAWDFVRRNILPTARLEGLRRIDGWEYPEEVVREAVVNAIAHRDYSIWGAEVLLEVYGDRIEITSPGSLPNTVTPEGMRAGLRFARNQGLMNVLRDYGYVESLGMGVAKKIIPGMRANNGTEPDLVDEEHRFIIRLWKRRSAT